MTAPHHSVKRLVRLLGLGLLIVPAVMLGSERGEAAPITFQAEVTGETYARQCAPCHGASGEGSDFGPALAGSRLPADDGIAVITEGAGAMPAYGPTLSPEQIEGLVSFIATLDGALPADGGTLYAERCAGCHGDRGEGGIGPSLQGSTAELEEQVVVIRDGGEGMPASGSSLSAEELEAVAAFSVAFQTVSSGAGPLDPVERGAEVYAGSCAGCHGGEGEGGAGPNLRNPDRPREALVEAVRAGLGTMPGFSGEIAPEDIEAVVTFLESLATAGDPSAPSLVAQGAELFMSNCARCHGPDASGGVGPALKNSPLSDTEMVAVISNGRGTMPAFSEILTSADSTALVAYVESTRGSDGAADPLTAVAHGREIYVTSCATCHGLDARGGVGPSLAGTRLTANEIISQVFGLHADRMPAFEGLLDPAQVQDVARYLLTVEGEPASQVGWLVAAVLAVLFVVGGGVLWYGGFLDRLLIRFRQG